MLNTLVSIVNEYMGSQWALFMPREYDAPQVLRERITFMKTIIRLDVDQNL